jgi:predicted DNA-binding transcriptional regulator AlpA
MIASNKTVTVPAEAALLSMAQLEVMLSMHRTRVFQFVREGLFPAPVKLGRTARWPRNVVEQWLEDLSTGVVNVPKNPGSAA